MAGDLGAAAPTTNTTLALDDLEFSIAPIAPSEGTTVWKKERTLKIRTGIRAGLFDSQNNSRGG